MTNGIRNSVLNYAISLSLWLLPVSCLADVPQTDGEILPFPKSDIFVMYSVEDRELLKKYRVDNISWGNQVNIYPKAVMISEARLRHDMEYGIKLNSIEVALVKEGGKYVICGNKWNFKCDKLYWGLKKNNHDDVTAQLISESISKRAVLDLHDRPVPIPWLIAGDVTLPIASVNDPGYKKWLIKKIDGILKIKPNAIHFDEPAMESAAIKTGRPFGLTPVSLLKFNRYLENTKEPGWKPENSQQLEGFDYKEYILANRSKRKKAIPPLWREFTDFKVSSNVKLFRELVAYAKEQADWPLLISANASPADWKTIPLVQYLDYIAPEINHHASKLEVPITPLYIYKMAEALGKPIVSTAYGTDWVKIKAGKHTVLASSWIAQAYAAGQYMNFPLKTWIPGSAYQPQSNIYPQLSGWIKEKSSLFDGYETIARHALLIGVEALRSWKDRKSLVDFTKKLIEKGVLFKIILEQEDPKIISTVSKFQDYESLIVVLPEYISKGTINKLQTQNKNIMVWKPSRDDMRLGLIKPEFTQVQLHDEAGVFGFPRKNSRGAVVLHLLNRDYLPDSKRMKTKGPFRVKVSKKIFGQTNIKSAILHQPMLNDESTDVSVNASSELTFKDDGEFLTITIPSLDLWGIVEFISK